MKIVITWLEKNVQWLAVALGAAYLLWMAYSFVVKTPAVATVNGKELTAGAVDPYIAENDARLLDAAIKSADTNPPRIMVPRFSDLVDRGLSSPPTPQTIAYWELPTNGVYDPEKGPTQPKGVPTAETQVTELPKPSAAQILAIQTYRTVVLDPNPNAVVKQHDGDFVTVYGSIPMAPLAAEFANKLKALGANFIPTTVILQAELVREEKLLGGGWGPPVVVARLQNQTDLQKYPGNQADKKDQSNYKAWASAAQPAILTPDFYQPAYPNRTDLLWKSLDKVLNDQAAEKAALLAPPPAPVAPPPPPPPPQPVRHAPQPAPHQPSGSVAPSGGGRQPTLYAPPPGPPGAPGLPSVGLLTPLSDNPAPTGTVPGVVVPQLAPPQSGPFNPATVATDMAVTLHDETVVPGHTYRYKIRYTILNPVYLQNAKVKDPSLADTFGIDAPEMTTPSEEVKIEERTKFWFPQAANQVNGNQAKVKVDVFTWADGSWRKKTYDVGPGDEIGTDEGAAGNFITGWSVLDIRRPNNKQPYALIAPDAGGDVRRRDAAADAGNKDYSDMQKRLEQAATPAPAASAN